MVGGVCAGLADYSGVSAGIVRSLFVLWALASRTGLLAYAALWIFLPAQGQARCTPAESWRHGIEEMRSGVRAIARELQQSLRPAVGQRPAGRRAWMVGGLLIAVGSLVLAEHLGWWGWLELGRLWPVVLILAGIVMFGRALRVWRRAPDQG